MEGKNNSPCAACRSARRKCSSSCIMKDFFPSNKAQDFEDCKQIFGAHNILKRISEVEPQHRANCVESMIWEARSWKEDPVNGAFARYKQLLATYEEVMAENSILKSQGTAESFGFDWDGLLGEPSMGAGAMQQLHFTDEQQQQGPPGSMEQLDSCYQQQDPIGAMEEFQFHSDQQQQQQQPPLVTVIDSGSQFTNDHFSNNSNHQGVLNSVMDQTLDDFLDNVTINVDNYYDPSAATIAQNLNPTGAMEEFQFQQQQQQQQQGLE